MSKSDNKSKIDDFKSYEEYLESLIPNNDEDSLRKKYFNNFEKYASYLGNGVYTWDGFYSSCTRELWLMGALHREKIIFEKL
ncbi:hypothetical protein BPT24_223 [Tenacibaculum phage pT24]|uniref:Uncharacterized protein n=1 Tax=Tenacibaculum phage pT24 TaxID=1880590 RepID=A0A1B4XX24_9CAUD|nr:hypothetical protein HYP10_gp223 [Tenacibaculum phage pT24]BAV39347.1 hypothetical protein BPT24_223 [Tenacibaculum phage pT24]